MNVCRKSVVTKLGKNLKKEIQSLHWNFLSKHTQERYLENPVTFGHFNFLRRWNRKKQNAKAKKSGAGTHAREHETIGGHSVHLSSTRSSARCQLAASCGCTQTSRISRTRFGPMIVSSQILQLVSSKILLERLNTTARIGQPFRACQWRFPIKNKRDNDNGNGSTNDCGYFLHLIWKKLDLWVQILPTILTTTRKWPHPGTNTRKTQQINYPSWINYPTQTSADFGDRPQDFDTKSSGLKWYAVVRTL